MKSIIARVKIYAIAMLTALCCLVGMHSAKAQVINVTVNILPPYSPYYSDYTGINASKTLLIIQNLSATTQSIQLGGKLQGDNGILISTRRGYKAARPITMAPHEIKQLNGATLKDVFDINNLNVYGIDAANLARSSRIPEGNYTFCIQANDYVTGNLLSAAAPLGCTVVTITNPEPPLLVGPIREEHVRATPSQTTFFTWTNPGSVPAGTQYKLELAEMPDVAKDPDQVINATSFPILSTVVTGTSYMYNMRNVPLKPGKRYAWRVTSIDPNNRVVFRNNGASPASIFTYEPADDAAALAVLPAATPVQQKFGYSVGGRLTYQYHLNGDVPQITGFTGVRSDSLPLRYTHIQLCYGLRQVKADIRTYQVDNVEQTRSKNDGLKQVALKSYTVTDTIALSGPVLGDPTFMNEGVVVKDATTDSLGNYTFNFDTPNKNAIVAYDATSHTALVFCYYINIVDRHYSDPLSYIFVRPSANGETATGNGGTQNVYANNYNLSVIIPRGENNADKGAQQGVSLESGGDTKMHVYILRKNVLPQGVPVDEGDNTGHMKFTPKNDPQNYFTNNAFYVVAQRLSPMVYTKDGSLDPYYHTYTTFDNLVDNLNTDESYWIYAEYDKTRVFFTPMEASQAPDQDLDYKPQTTPITRVFQKLMQPAYTDVTIKGVLKYQFKNAIPKPLGNTVVTLQSVGYSQGPNNTRVYDFDNTKKANKQYAAYTTGDDGYFELQPSSILNFDDYMVSGFENNSVGHSLFVYVNNTYYGSPITAYDLEAGNTYNIGEVVADVKEYNMTVNVQLAAKPGQATISLGDQRVYLCRRSDFDKKSLGIPADEIGQNSLPVKKLTFGTTDYDVLGYGVTDGSGNVSFPRAVVNDLLNHDDYYYLYSESGVLSELNYSTGTPQAVLNSINGFKLQNPQIYNSPVTNTQVLSTPLTRTITLVTTPQKPFIDGAVYPFGNNSTNALDNVSVMLYDVNADITTAMVDTAAKHEDIQNYMTWLVFLKLARPQDSQSTPASGLFNFQDLMTDQYKGWKILVYVKDGFISGYTCINSGKPMTSGVKENVKGFVYPPRLVQAYISDAISGVPVKAKVIVGDNFSWAQSQTTNDSPARELAQMHSTYGPVTFTVIPDDNVNYHTQTFTRTIAPPNDNNAVLGKDAIDNNYSSMLPFFMNRPSNTIQICVNDAANGKSIASHIAFTGIPVTEAPKEQDIPINRCPNITFLSAVTQYGVTITSPGYIPQTVQINAVNAPGAVTYLNIPMQKGLSIAGIVTVNGARVPGVKVYIKELADTYPDVTTDANGSYLIEGLPSNNNVVTVVATYPGTSGASKAIALFPVNANINGRVVSVTKLSQNFTLTAVPAAFDLTKLYGFPLDVESFTTKANGNYALTGRITMPANLNIKPSGDEHLTLTNIEVKPVSAQVSRGEKTAVKPTKGDIILDENTADVTTFNKYPATFSNANGIKLIAKNNEYTDGTLFGGLSITSDGFSRSISWAGQLVLNPTAPAAGSGIPNPGVGNNGVPGIGNQVAGTPAVSGNNLNLPAPGGGIPGSGSMVSGLGGQVNGPGGTGGGAFNQAASNALPQSPADYFDVFSASNAKPYTNLYIYATGGYNFTYQLNNTYTVDATRTSYIDLRGLNTFSTIHTNLANANTPDIRLIGQLVYTDAPGLKIIGPTDFSIGLDSWKITGNWHIGQGNIKVNGNLFAGTITVPVTDMEVSNTSIGYGNIQVDKIGLAGVYPMTINPDPKVTSTSFGYDKAAKYGMLNNPQYGAWSLSLLPVDAKGSLTQLTGLPDLAVGDAIGIMNISLYSKGDESHILLTQGQNSVTLNGYANFQPGEIENGSDFFTIHGALDLKIPNLTGLSDKVYDLQYKASNGTLVHSNTPLPDLQIVTKGIRADFPANAIGQVFSNNQLVLPGFIQDKVPNSPYKLKVNLNKTSATAQDITVQKDDAVNKVTLGQDKLIKSDQYLTAITGSMTGDDKAWNNFSFEGDVAGADGMRDAKSVDPGTKKTHMAFDVKGDLVVSKSQLGVKNMSIGDARNANFTYDLDLNAIVGSFHLKEETPNATFETDFDLMLGAGQWYMLGAAQISNITGTPLPVNGAGGAVLVGRCTITDDMMGVLQSQFHNGILPNGFTAQFGHLNGALMISTLDMNIPLVPDINLDLQPIVSVHVDKGIYANMYTSLSFDDTPVMTGGIKVGVYVKVNAGATVLGGCEGIGLSAEVNTQVNAKLVLPSYKTFMSLNPKALLEQTEVTLNADAGVLLAGNAYVGFGVCNTDCESISALGVTIPPGCIKVGIGKSLELHFGVDVYKRAKVATPDRSDVYLDLLGSRPTIPFNLPHL